METRSFLDYYAQHDIIPVHYRRGESFTFSRNHLLATLGIPPALIRGSSVLEFGPGTGDNASVVLSHGPSRLVLVDGNPKSLSSVRALFKRAESERDICSLEILDQSVEGFSSEEQFDLVIAENIIPGQLEPATFAKHISSFVRPGGVLALTCASPPGLVSSICRHLARPEMIRRGKSFEGALALGASLFSDHLASLGPLSRSSEDWVTDNVLHDWIPASLDLFTPNLASRVLVELGFDILGTSPRIGEDGRWFKHAVPGSAPFAAQLMPRFDEFLPGLLDYRVSPDVRISDPGIVLEIGALISELFRLHHQILSESAYESLPAFLDTLRKVATMLPPESSATVDGIEDFCGPAGILDFLDGASNFCGPQFGEWWGRGTIHMSFWKNLSGPVVRA